MRFRVLLLWLLGVVRVVAPSEDVVFQDLASRVRIKIYVGGFEKLQELYPSCQHFQKAWSSAYRHPQNACHLHVKNGIVFIGKPRSQPLFLSDRAHELCKYSSTLLTVCVSCVGLQYKYCFHLSLGSRPCA